MTHRTCRKTVKRSGFTDAYLTTVATSPITDEAQLNDVFEQVAAAIAEDRAALLQEKVYGLCSAQRAILAARARAFEKHGLDLECPPTFIEGAPCIGGLLAGVQTIGVVCESTATAVKTIRVRGTPVGRELSTGGCRMLFYAGVSGFDPQAQRNVTEQAGAMFENVRALLADQGLSCKHIVRTWIYMARLLDWYGEFNRVRTSSYRRFGIIGSDGNSMLPASTGIQGRRTEGEECFMDVLAIASGDTERYATAQMRNARQNEAHEYGSSFSRGMAVGNGDHPTLWVSGTASINAQGKTVHHGDEQNQVMETMLAIAALLEGQGSRLRDICQATAYCKGHGDYRAFERIVDHLDMKDIPFVPVLADVCRDELLFEIDSVAVKGVAQSYGARDGVCR